MGATRADVVFNCAAWTDVDGAESSPDEALAVNGAGAGNVARAAAASGAWTIHVSSDYVFDGTKRSPYVESDAVGPVSSYGRSKLAGEREVAAQAPGRHTIVRSSWLFGARSVLPGDDPPARGRARRAERGRRPGRVPDVHRAPGVGAGWTSRRAGRSGWCTWPVAGRARGTSSRARSWPVRGCGARSSRARRPTCRGRRRAPPTACFGSERGDEAPALPDWRHGLADYTAVTRAVSAR